MDKLIEQALQLMSEANRARLDDRPDDAHRDYAAVISLCRQTEARRELIRALKGLGQIERDQDRGDAALPLYEEAVVISREEGDPAPARACGATCWRYPPGRWPGGTR